MPTLRTVWQVLKVLSQLASDNVLVQSSVVFQLVYLRTTS